MTIQEAAKMRYPRDNEQDYSYRLNFEKGAEWMKQKAFCAFDETFRTDEEYNQLREAFDKMLSE